MTQSEGDCSRNLKACNHLFSNNCEVSEYWSQFVVTN